MNIYRITLIPDKDLSVWLEVDGSDIDDVLSFKVKINIYKEALQHLHRDVIATYNKNKHEDKSEFLWLITAKNHRPDGLIETIHFYYLFHLIDHFLVAKANAILRSEVFLPPFFHTFLQKQYGNRFSGRFFFKNLLEYRLRQWLHPLKRIKSIRHLVRLTPEKAKAGAILLQSASDFKKMRFRGFDQRFEGESCLLFPKDVFHSIRNFMPGHKPVQLALRNFLSTFWMALWTGLSVQQKINSQESTLHEMHRGEQVYSQTLFVLWRQLLTEEIMRKYLPSEVIVVQTFGDPQSRYLTFAAEKYGVKTTIFACRPMISPLRPEDAVLPFEISVEKEPLYGLGQQLYVFDKFSLNSVVRSGYPATRVKCHEPPVLSGQWRGQKLAKGFLFLLAGEEMNLQLFPLLNKFVTNNQQYKFYLKNHPLLEFTKKEKNLIERAFGERAIDISKENLHELDLAEVVAITTYSTSGVEAVARGAGLVWLPFLTERFIQFAEVFDAIGKVAYQQNDFLQIMSQLQYEDDFYALIKESQAEYAKEFQFS